MGGDYLPEEIRTKKLKDLEGGHYNDQVITIMPGYKPNLDIEESFLPQKPITKTVKEIGTFLVNGYSEKLSRPYHNVDVKKEAIRIVEEEGIVFLDQIDKLAVPEGPSTSGKGVSTQGVQRDLLPLIEGTTISTKFGDVKTDHILFIASGSFYSSKVEDLMPELLGRLPIRVTLSPISKAELIRILKEPQFNLLMQQQRLLEVEKVSIVFTDDSIEEIAEMAYQMNCHLENIGTRRLHAVVEKVMEDISFNAPQYKGQTFTIDQEYVRKRMENEKKSQNLAKFLI